MELKDKLGLGFFVMLLAIVLGIISGWVMNILDILHMNPWVWNGEGIMRIIGIFIAPIGAIMGWFF